MRISPQMSTRFLCIPGSDAGFPPPPPSLTLPPAVAAPDRWGKMRGSSVGKTKTGNGSREVCVLLCVCVCVCARGSQWRRRVMEMSAGNSWMVWWGGGPSNSGSGSGPGKLLLLSPSAPECRLHHAQCCLLASISLPKLKPPLHQQALGTGGQYGYTSFSQSDQTSRTFLDLDWDIFSDKLTSVDFTVFSNPAQHSFFLT